MIRWLVTNLRTFLWALIMALAVWVAAVSAADPDEVRLYPKPVQIEIVGQDPGLVITGIDAARSEFRMGQAAQR